MSEGKLGAGSDRIGRELQARYTFNDIDVYLAAFGIDISKSTGFGSKWLYVKDALSSVSQNTLAQLVEDLELGTLTATVASYSPPSNWVNTEDFRLFISHIAVHKDKATRLRECLDPYAISGFVAHEDINPTSTWETEIERALNCMDAMVTIHTRGFARSSWTQQEIGFALGRGVKVISLKFDEDPTGFIARRQALARRGRPAEAIAEEIDRLLLDDERTRERLQAARDERNRLATDENTLPF